MIVPAAVVVLAIPRVPQVPQGPVPPWMILPPQVVVILAFAVIGAAVIILLPLMRAIGRRIGGSSGDRELRQEVTELRTRIEKTERSALTSGDVDLSEERIGELEDRLEFVERMLTREKEGSDG